MVPMTSNVRREANRDNDRGAVPDSLQLDHMVLLLKRTPEREAALKSYMEATQTKGNPNFHHWLTAERLGREYGPDKADIESVSVWLKSHGFNVDKVAKSGMMIDFSGTASQVTEAFKSEIHSLEVKGEKHIGNLETPRIPAALAPAIAGIASLNDLRPHPAAVHARPRATTGSQPRGVLPDFTINSFYQLLTPADFATIYNYAPVLQSGITGDGYTVVAIEPTDLYSVQDVETYRKTFVPGFTGYFSQEHPDGCKDPGLYTPWLFEAIVDVESITASAPGAHVVADTCASTNTTFGSFIALENLIDQEYMPAIVSVSIGECETELGESGNRYINYMYQQAASEGVSVFVSSNDNGAAGCDDFDTESAAYYGIAVNGLASTPYNVAVGGTDFGDSYMGTNDKYWYQHNSKTYGSAHLYVPEIPWNDSCASTLLTNYYGYGVPFGSSGFCNSDIGSYFLNIVAGSGGPSGCASGETDPAPGTPAVSGTCQGRPKPNWQYGLVGVPNDGVRDLPDVSLFAANGSWGHYYTFCFSDVAEGGAPCTGNPVSWAGGGGTSASAPLMAGIQALINQSQGNRQGNPNYVLYNIARTEYGRTGNTACDSTYGGDACSFHDVTLGDNNVDCISTSNCFLPSGDYGVLSLYDNHYYKAFNARRGWDFATGIGTLNVKKLIANWAAAE